MVNPNLGYSNILITTKAISIIRIMMSVLCMEIPILMSLWCIENWAMITYAIQYNSYNIECWNY